MRKILTSLFALALTAQALLVVSVPSVFAGGTLTLMGVGPGNNAKPPVSISSTDNVTSTSGVTSHSFSVNIGSADPSRLVVVAVQLGSTTLSSPVIGGVSATIYAQSGSTVAIFGAVVPTGTTATVTYTTSGAFGNYGNVWAIYNLNSPTPIDTKTSTTLGNQSLSMVTQAGGAFIGAAVGFRSGGLTVTLGNFTQNFTGAYNANYRMSAGSVLTASTSLTATTTWSAAPTSLTGFIGVAWR